ncbi:MAG TPA: hypothetical protein VG435_08515, partial [Acidimicrobiales bacterium]|nr:hypothetical protein [Acidimicrobiales bacterium]
VGDVAAVRQAARAAIDIGERLRGLEMLQAAARLGGMPPAEQDGLRSEIEQLRRDTENASSPL